MATITSVKSGNWTDPNTWDLGRKPQDGDDVIIANGHIVIYDEDMSSWANGVNSIKIDGTTQETRLKCHRTQDTYLKCVGNIYGNDYNYSILDWGTESDYIQAKSTIEITGGGKIYARASTGHIKLLIYGKDKGKIETTLSQDANIGSSEIYIIDSDFSVEQGDELLIEGNNHGECEFVSVQSYDPVAQKIILNETLEYSHKEGFYVYNLTRNIKILKLGGSTIFYGIGYSEKIKLANWTLKGYGNFSGTWWSGEYVYIENAAIYSIRTSYNWLFGNNVNKYYFKKCIIAMKYQFGNIFINGAGSIYAENCIFLNTNIFWATHGIIKNSKFLACQNLFRQGACFKVYNTFLRNIKNIGGDYANSKVIYYSCEFYNISAIKGGNIEVINPQGDDLSSLFVQHKSIMVGGKYELKNGNLYISVNSDGEKRLDISIYKNLSFSVKFILNEYYIVFKKGVYHDFKIYLKSGIQYKFFVWVRKDTSGISEQYRPRIQLIDENNDPIFLENSALAEAIMSDSVDTWEKLEITYTPNESKIYKIRLWAGYDENVGAYSCWFDADPLDDMFFQKQINEPYMQLRLVSKMNKTELKGVMTR